MNDKFLGHKFDTSEYIVTPARPCSKCNALQTKLDKAVEALERIEIADTDYRIGLDENMNIVRGIAQQTLAEIKEIKI